MTDRAASMVTTIPPLTISSIFCLACPNTPAHKPAAIAIDIPNARSVFIVSFSQVPRVSKSQGCPISRASFAQEVGLFKSGDLEFVPCPLHHNVVPKTHLTTHLICLTPAKSRSSAVAQTMHSL